VGIDLPLFPRSSPIFRRVDIDQVAPLAGREGDGLSAEGARQVLERQQPGGQESFHDGQGCPAQEKGKSDPAIVLHEQGVFSRAQPADKCFQQGP